MPDRDIAHAGPQGRYLNDERFEGLGVEIADKHLRTARDEGTGTLSTDAGAPAMISTRSFAIGLFLPIQMSSHFAQRNRIGFDSRVADALCSKWSRQIESAQGRNNIGRVVTLCPTIRLSMRPHRL